MNYYLSHRNTKNYKLKKLQTNTKNYKKCTSSSFYSTTLQAECTNFKVLVAEVQFQQLLHDFSCKTFLVARKVIITSISHTITICVSLITVRNEPAVITSISHTIFIFVSLISVPSKWAVVTNISNTIVISVSLIWITLPKQVTVVVYIYCMEKNKKLV